MNRRGFLRRLAGLTLAATAAPLHVLGASSGTRLFLAGDVMTGRGIDQVLPHAGDPRLHEPFLWHARSYVNLAEQRNGPIPRPVDFEYIWGDALAILDRFAPAVRIVNLETAVTTADEHWQDKSVHYRMHPHNVPCLTTAGLDCCVLANNHVLDWGYRGLEETLRTLHDAGIHTAGAGRHLAEAARPAALELPGGRRVRVFGFGHPDSGIPSDWRASADRGGVDLLRDYSSGQIERIAKQVQAERRPGDVTIASIHWGGNWGYRVAQTHRRFARGLIDTAGIDIVHGHSSHHPRGIEIYNNKPIFYGCGDLINDYEGIEGHEEYRGDLTLMYFPVLDETSAELLRLDMVPMRIKRFRLQRADEEEARWLTDMLGREGEALGTRAQLTAEKIITLEWN